jgi:hypothetical protein
MRGSAWPARNKSRANCPSLPAFHLISRQRARAVLMLRRRGAGAHADLEGILAVACFGERCVRARLLSVGAGCCW